MYKLMPAIRNSNNGYSWINTVEKIEDNFLSSITEAKRWFENHIRESFVGFDRRQTLFDRRTHVDRRDRVTNFDRRQNEIGRRYTDYINFYS